jgi:hypothetical protein
VKKLICLLILTSLSASLVAQGGKEKKNEKKEERRRKVNELIKQAEEGVLVYRKQNIFGFQFRTNGYGGFYEMGRMKTTRRTNIYRLDITEIKSQKEEKSSSIGFFGNPYIYGKLNYFYPVTIAFGQQHILGQKGNKNGVAVSVVYMGGLSLGLLRPYYLEVEDPNGGENKVIKYSQADSSLFLGTGIVGAGGLGKGWSDMKMKPGAFAKTALRFDWGRFNETVTGMEIGLSGQFYSSKIPIYFAQKERIFFFQAHIAFLFGQRK